MAQFIIGTILGFVVGIALMVGYVKPAPICPDCQQDLRRTYDGYWYCWHCHFENKAKA